MTKSKVETAEQYAIRKAKEAKEIAKWEKEKARPKGKWYFYYFLLIVTIVYIVDEVTTQIGTQMQNVIKSVLSDMLGGTSAATSMLNLISTLTIVSSVFAFFYKPLSDRYGRKIFLVINTLGMGLGMLIVGLTVHISTYIMGVLVINFFTPHDMQVIYIQETCPKEKRGTYYTVIKSIATLGLLIIPFLKSHFISESDFSNWRYVYLIPTIIALVISIIALCCMRETDPFIENRLKYLRMSDQEREEAKKQKEASAQKNGAIEGLKYIFTHKAVLWLALADIFIWMGIGIAQNYNVIMEYSFAGITSIEEVTALGDTLKTALEATETQINQALYLFPIGSAIAQLIPGFVADKFGRRVAAIFSSVFSVTTFVVFWIGLNTGMSPYLIGLFIGLAVGAYWLIGDMAYFICSELVPTSVRVSVINAFDLFMYPGLLVGMLLPSVAGVIIGSDIYLALFTVINSIVGLTIASILLMVKVRETKGVNIAEVTGNEE